MATSEERKLDDSTPRKRAAGGTGTHIPSPLGVTPRSPLPQQYKMPIQAPWFGEKARHVNGFSHNAHHQNGSSSRWFSFFKFGSDKEDDKFTKLKPRPEDIKEDSSTKSFIFLGLIFVAALLSLGVVYLNFPNLDPGEKQFIKVPKDIEDAKNLGRILSVYKEKYYFQVLGAYFIMYIFLQSFAIPGSIFLSILSGFLFPFPLALFLVCLCSAIGASFCYFLSYLVGKQLVQKYIPERAADWSQHVQRHREHLLNYIIFLRITPFLPNWFINITSPVINVPLKPFFMGTFFGVVPPSFVAIQAGTTLHTLTSSGDAISWTSIIVLAFFALLSLIPVIFKKRLQKKFD